MNALTYSGIRDQIRSGDLVALTHKKWGSWYDLQVQLVRTFTQSEYCHVGMLLVFGGRVWVLESVRPVVRMVPLSTIAVDDFYWIPLNAPISDAELEAALADVGIAQYSRWQAFLAGIRWLKIGADRIWECAEWVIAKRAMSGVDLGSEATPSAVVRTAQISGAPCFLISKAEEEKHA